MKKFEISNSNNNLYFKKFKQLTRKAIGFKSLRLNCLDISQVIQKCKMLTTVSKT